MLNVLHKDTTRLFINKAFSFIKGALIQPEADLAQFPGDISEKSVLLVGGFSSLFILSMCQ